MYERMLNKQVKPTVADMTGYCGENAELFTYLNEWLEKTFQTEGCVSLWKSIWLGDCSQEKKESHL